MKTRAKHLTPRVERPIAFTAFCRDVLALRLTRGQRVFAKVLFDGVDPIDLPDDELTIAREMFGPVDHVPPDARKTLVGSCGRASGKSTIVAAYAIFAMATADLSRCGPGDIPVVLVVAPVRALARSVLRMANAFAEALCARVQAVTFVKSGQTGFQLRRHDARVVALEVCTATKTAPRGVSVIAAIFDEAEFLVGDEAYANTDREILDSITPRLLGACVMISTPWPVPTVMGSLVESDFGAPVRALVAVAQTVVMRDHDPSVVRMVAAEDARDLVNADREFRCDRRAALGSGAFFSHEALERAVRDDLPLSSATPSGAFIGVGTDLAFTSDSSALAVVARVGDRYSLLHVEELRPARGAPLKPSEVIASFAATAKRYGARSVAADVHYKESARELLAPYHLSFSELPGGVTGKQNTYVAARAIFHEGRFAMARNARLIAQLRDVRSAPLPGGATRIWSPRRAGLAHGDIASAVIAAIWAAKGNAPATFDEDAARMFARAGSRRFEHASAGDSDWDDDEDPAWVANAISGSTLNSF